MCKSGCLRFILSPPSFFASSLVHTRTQTPTPTHTLSLSLRLPSADILSQNSNGYTVSAICHCTVDNSFLSGCTTDLWENSCGEDGETLHRNLGACQNPTNDGTFTTDAATSFFKPCAGKAYTFPSDNDANNGGTCTSGAVTCCVGTEADGCPSMS